MLIRFKIIDRVKFEISTILDKLEISKNKRRRGEYK